MLKSHQKALFQLSEENPKAFTKQTLLMSLATLNKSTRFR
jgi:hypothetical protein